MTHEKSTNFCVLFVSLFCQQTLFFFLGDFLSIPLRPQPCCLLRVSKKTSSQKGRNEVPRRASSTPSEAITHAS